MNKAIRRWGGLSVIGLWLVGVVNASSAHPICSRCSPVGARAKAAPPTSTTTTTSAHPTSSPSSPTGDRVGEKGSEPSRSNRRRHHRVFQSTTRYCAGTADPKARRLARTSWPGFAYNDAMRVFEDPPRRDKQLLIRLTAQEKMRLEKAAEKRRITAAELIRRAVNAYLPSTKKKKVKRKKKT